jgi:hypothetical protein
MRRLDVVVDFGRPDVAERLKLWKLHLPEPHCIDDKDLFRVATTQVLTGGQIRNAALFVALLALEDGTEPTNDHLDLAIQREYRKASMAYTPIQSPPEKNPLARLGRVESAEQNTEEAADALESNPS